jgi:dephospho-CoA kinase
VIAITGGVATGKSTVTALLGELLPAESFNTDVSARQLLENDPEVLREMRAAFDAGAFDAQGQIDRAALRRLVFESPERRTALEAILHPRIRAAWQGWAQDRLQMDADALLLVEIPLLYETGAAILFARTIVVGCAPETQQLRLTGQRRLSADQARLMAASQLDLSEKIRQCDHLIWNDGSEDGLRAQAALCARYLQSLYRRTTHTPTHD